MFLYIGDNKKTLSVEKLFRLLVLGPCIEGKVSRKYLIKVRKENLRVADFGFWRREEKKVSKITKKVKVV